jgi:hypothetical protein
MAMKKMSEVIQSIEEVTVKDEGKWESNAGYKIVTSDQEILFLIDDGRSCCESWGYFTSEDDFVKFVGAILTGITVTDTNRTSRVINQDYNYDSSDDEDITLDQGDVMFVDVETDRGILQLVAYNAHNGYYGHEAKIISKQLTLEKVL